MEADDRILMLIPDDYHDYNDHYGYTERLEKKAFVIRSIKFYRQRHPQSNDRNSIVCTQPACAEDKGHGKDKTEGRGDFKSARDDKDDYENHDDEDEDDDEDSDYNEESEFPND